MAHFYLTLPYYLLYVLHFFVRFTKKTKIVEENIAFDGLKFLGLIFLSDAKFNES